MIPFHGLDPFVGLALGINEEGPPPRELSDDTVLNGQGVPRKTCKQCEAQLACCQHSMHTVYIVQHQNDNQYVLQNSHYMYFNDVCVKSTSVTK